MRKSLSYYLKFEKVLILLFSLLITEVVSYVTLGVFLTTDLQLIAAS